jgi:hypothetical protein
VFQAKIDGQTVFSASAVQTDTYAAYTLVRLDVSAFADGGSHALDFTATTSDQQVNFNLDNVWLGCTR